jgi:hypothetical protein
MTQNTLTLDGAYASMSDEAGQYLGALAATGPTPGASTADLDALLTQFGAYNPFVLAGPGAGEPLDQESAMNALILAGLVSP